MITLSWVRKLFGMKSRVNEPARESAESFPTLFYPPSGCSQVRDSRLEVAIHDLAGEVVVRLVGEASCLESGVLDAELLPVCARRPALVTLDLSELLFISSIVMGILVRFHLHVVRTGGRLRVTAVRAEVREAMERAGLTMLLEAIDVSDVPQVEGRDLAPAQA
jgi:anti-anti-sigma factor